MDSMNRINRINDVNDMNDKEIDNIHISVDTVSQNDQPKGVRKLISTMSFNLGQQIGKAATAVCDNNHKEATQIATDGEEFLRKSYVEIFNQQTGHLDNPLWWKNEFTNAGLVLLDIFIKQAQEQPAKSKEITIAYNGELHTFNNNMVITIGRYRGCDIEFPVCATYGSSRLHGLLFLLPEINKYIVVDMGSLQGIVTEKRSSEKDCVNSLPKQRNVLVFDFDEIAILRMGNLRVAVNPKECVVCFERPRGITYDCGHHVVCSVCNESIADCPICRKYIHNRKMELALCTKMR